MKPANFPARKEARKVAAEKRASGAKGTTAREVLNDNPVSFEVARAVRTKKPRVSKRF